MLVMFGNNAMLVLAIVQSDVDKIRAGRTLEYINPPHAPQLVKDIVVMYGRDKADVLRQVRAAGVAVDDVTVDKFLAGARTDKGFLTN